MPKHGKKYRELAEQAPAETLDLDAAISFLKKNATATFDETMELALRMGVDPRKSDMAIRSSVSLPHGSGQTVRVLVFASGPAADAAKEAGADFVGSEDMIEKVKGGWTDFDVAIATPDAMKEVRKLGRVLGPRGLMPNPKVGTVTPDVETAVKNAKAGQVRFRTDKAGIIHSTIGKANFESQALRENLSALLAELVKLKPASAKGQYLMKVALSTTMGPGVVVDHTQIEY